VNFVHHNYECFHDIKKYSSSFLYVFQLPHSSNKLFHKYNIVYIKDLFLGISLYG